MQTPSHSEEPGDGVVSGDRLEAPGKNRARNLLIACLFVEAWLVFLHFRLAMHATPSVRLLGQAFDVTRESSVATYWSSLLALGVGVISFFTAYLLRENGASALRSRAWMFIGTVFVLISVDDAIAFHEKIGSITSLGIMRSLNYSSYPWHITVAPFIALGLLLAVYFIWKDIRKVNGLSAMLILALVCFAAAFGLDYVEGLKEMVAVNSGELAPGSEHLPLLRLTEEMLEMGATTLFLYVVFTYLTHLMRSVGISLGRSGVEKMEEVSST